MSKSSKIKVGSKIKVISSFNVSFPSERTIKEGQLGQVFQIIGDVAMILPWDTGHEVMTNLSNLEIASTEAKP